MISAWAAGSIWHVSSDPSAAVSEPSCCSSSCARTPSRITSTDQIQRHSAEHCQMTAAMATAVTTAEPIIKNNGSTEKAAGRRSKKDLRPVLLSWNLYHKLLYQFIHINISIKMHPNRIQRSRCAAGKLSPAAHPEISASIQKVF